VSARFQVELERARHAPGGTIRGTILVLEGGPSRSLEVLLEFKEESKGASGVATSVSTGSLHDDRVITPTSHPRGDPAIRGLALGPALDVSVYGDEATPSLHRGHHDPIRRGPDAFVLQLHVELGAGGRSRFNG
jgi:hypothetical protein